MGDEFQPEFNDLHPEVRNEILAHSRLLQQFGPLLGRPRVDTLDESRHANMKELRFDAADGVWRVRKQVEARAAQLIAEEMTLRELRRARKITQQKIAKSLNIGQEGVSKIERRSDLLISTLRRTVEAMGGSLSLVAEFPDRDPVVLSGIAEDEPTKPTGRKHAAHV